MKSAPSKIIIVALVNTIIYFGLYLAFTNNTGFRELIAGGVVAIISTIATLVFSSAGKVRFRFRLGDIAQAWRMPWYAVDGAVEVLHGLANQLFKPRGARSFLAAVPFETGKHGSLADAGRRALEITYTTATPNFIIIGIIEEQKLLLYHQIIPGKVLTMTKNLGGAIMNFFLLAAAGILICLIPAGVVCFRGQLGDRLVGLEFASALVTIELLLLAEGYHRPSFFDLPLTLAFLSFGGGMVFARFVQRWL